MARRRRVRAAAVAALLALASPARGLDEAAGISVRLSIVAGTNGHLSAIYDLGAIAPPRAGPHPLTPTWSSPPWS